MSPVSRRRRERRAVRGAAQGGPRRWRLRAVLLVAVGIAAATIVVWRGRPQRAPGPRAGAGLATEAVTDSQRAAFASGAWDRSVVWAEVLLAREPGSAMRTLGVGLAWHNLAWGGSPYARSRPATRTSLDRIAMERHALALLDSATTRARAPEDWARIRHWRAQIHENLGLPVDALEGYDEVLQRVPEFPSTRERARWVLERLNDPLRSDAQPVTE